MAVTTCAAADTPKYGVGAVIAERHGGGNPIYSYYAVLNAEYKIPESYGMESWVYDLLPVYKYPSGNRWYALEGEEPKERYQDQMQYSAGYSFFDTGDGVNTNSIPREHAIIKFPPLKYQQDDIVQVKGGGYSIIYWTETSDDYEGIYYAGEIRKKADGTWGYVLRDRYQSLNFWIFQKELESSVTQLVTHLPNRDGIEVVDEFPTIVPITTAPIVTTLIPIKIDTPKGPSTLPPTPIRTEGPSENPFYPINPTPVIVQPISPVSGEPVLVSPVEIIPTVQPTFRFGKRYAVGDPGSFLGTKYGSGDITTVTKRSRTVTGSDTVLKPGSRSYGITPPKGQFVRWYPSARWQAGIK